MYDDVLKLITKIYPYMDRDSAELALATVLSTKVETKTPVFLAIVGVPSSGKSTQFGWLEGLHDKDFNPLCFRVDDFTAASIQDWAEKAAGKCLLISDLVKLLEAGPDVWATLRLYYEGTVEKEAARSSGRSAHVKTRLTLLAATTHFLDAYFEPEMKVGAIMLKYRVPQKTREQQLEIVMGKRPTPQDDAQIAERLQEFVLELDENRLTNITLPFKEELGKICYGVELMRQILKKDQKPGMEVTSVRPKPAEIMRLYGQAETLCIVLAWIRGKDSVSWDEVTTVSKAVVGTIPDIRHEIVDRLYQSKGEWKVYKDDSFDSLTEYAEEVGLLPKELEYYLKDLARCRIIKITNKPMSKFDLTGNQKDKNVKVMTTVYRLASPIMESIELMRSYPKPVWMTDEERIREAADHFLAQQEEKMKKEYEELQDKLYPGWESAVESLQEVPCEHPKNLQTMIPDEGRLCGICNQFLEDED